MEPKESLPYLNKQSKNGFVLHNFKLKPNDKHLSMENKSKNYNTKHDYNANEMYGAASKNQTNPIARVQSHIVDQYHEMSNSELAFLNTNHIHQAPIVLTPQPPKGPLYSTDPFRSPVMNPNSVLAASTFYSAYLAANRNSPYLPYLHALVQQRNQVNIVDQQQQQQQLHQVNAVSNSSTIQSTGNSLHSTGSKQFQSAHRRKTSPVHMQSFEHGPRSRSRSRSPVNYKYKSKKFETNHTGQGTQQHLSKTLTNNQVNKKECENEPLDLSIKSLSKKHYDNNTITQIDSTGKRKHNQIDNEQPVDTTKKTRLSTTCFTVDKILSGNLNTNVQSKSKELADYGELKLTMLCTKSPKSTIISSVSPTSCSTSPLSTISCPPASLSSFNHLNEHFSCNFCDSKYSNFDCLKQHFESHSKIYLGKFFIIFYFVDSKMQTHFIIIVFSL
jgi:hypothetical protein